MQHETRDVWNDAYRQTWVASTSRQDKQHEYRTLTQEFFLNSSRYKNYLYLILKYLYSGKILTAAKPIISCLGM